MTSVLLVAGDAANEPSLCVDPTAPNFTAVGCRQFDMTNSNFRQLGVAYTTNGGLNWTFPGNLINVMLSRSTDGSRTGSVPLRISDDSPDQDAAYWFGTLSAGPNGRINGCWNDTRHSKHS